LRAYDRWQRLVAPRWPLAAARPAVAAVIRQNIGTIIDTETLKVRLKGRMGGVPLGEIEEGFAATLTPGDTFLIGGEVVRYEGLRELTVEVTRNPGRDPKVAVFNGTKFATSTQLATGSWHAPAIRVARPARPYRRWLALQRQVSRLPEPGRLLVESFAWDGREQTLPLRLCGAQRAADARPAADQPDGGGRG
jgi:ATP-dependent helicase Lhr and Lhr-like helicase